MYSVRILTGLMVKLVHSQLGYCRSQG